MNVRNVYQNNKMKYLISRANGLDVKKSELLFNPFLESYDILMDWAAYRNLPYEDVTSYLQLQTMVHRDLIEHGNYPPFEHFTTFNPSYATIDFLIVWLSWHGIAANEHNALKLCKYILKPYRVTMLRDPVSRFHQLLQLDPRYQALTSLLQESELLVDMIPSEHFTDREQKAQHKQKNLSRKQFMAYLLGAGALVLPMVVNDVTRNYMWSGKEEKKEETKLPEAQAQNVFVHRHIIEHVKEKKKKEKYSDEIRN